jgi:hypothetical protein
MGSPSSDDWENECPGFAMICELLFGAKEIEHFAMIIKPFYYIQGQSNNVLEICLCREEVTHNKINLVCLAHQHDHPWILDIKEPPHLLSIRAVICAPSNHNHTEFVFDVLYIGFDDDEKLVSSLRQPRHVIHFHKIGLQECA